MNMHATSKGNFFSAGVENAGPAEAQVHFTAPGSDILDMDRIKTELRALCFYNCHV
jgi:hypothetical protein